MIATTEIIREQAAGSHRRGKRDNTEEETTEKSSSRQEKEYEAPVFFFSKMCSRNSRQRKIYVYANNITTSNGMDNERESERNENKTQKTKYCDMEGKHNNELENARAKMFAQQGTT